LGWKLPVTGFGIAGGEAFDTTDREKRDALGRHCAPHSGALRRLSFGAGAAGGKNNDGLSDFTLPQSRSAG
jgi:hypothetical protein